MKIPESGWFGLLPNGPCERGFPARSSAVAPRLFFNSRGIRGRGAILRCAASILSILVLSAACLSSGDEDSRVDLEEILTYAAILNESSVRTLTTDGVGLSGLLANQQARQRYAFSGSATGHLLVLYAAPGDAGATLDGAFDLATAAGQSVVSVDRRSQGLVERRETILSATQYLITVRAFTGTAGAYAVAVAGGVVSGGGGCTIGANKCRDYNAGTAESEARANCTAAGGVFSAAACTATNRVGQCTTGFFDSGATTVNGYSPGFANATLYQAECLTEFGVDEFVFQ